MGSTPSKPPLVAPSSPETREAVRKSLVGLDEPLKVLRQAVGDSNVLTILDSDQGPYESMRESPWNKLACRYAAVFVTPENEEHVRAAFEFCRASGLEVALSGGRHSPRCFIERACVIDFKHMSSVRVDPELRVVVAGPGARLGDIDRATKPHGLVFPTGTNADTGLGLTLSGGFGYLTRLYGLSVDHTRRLRVVLASGDIVDVTPNNEHADLFRVMRGCPGSFGAVVEYEFNVLPTRYPYIYQTAHLALTVGGKAAILDRFVAMEKTVPNEVSLFAVLPARAPVVVVIGVYNAEQPLDSFPEALRPLTTMGGWYGWWPKMQTVSKNVDHHTELQNLLAAVQAPCYQYDSAFLFDNWISDVSGVLASHAASGPSADTATLVFPIGGRGLEPLPGSPPSVTARHKYVVVNSCNFPAEKHQEVLEASRAWCQSMKKAVKDFGLGSGGLSYVTDDVNPLEEDYGSHSTSVSAIKKKYDPENFFKYGKSVV